MATPQNTTTFPPDIFYYVHKRDLEKKDIIWMSQNTNHLPITEKINEAIIASIKNYEYSKYPYPKGVFDFNGNSLPSEILNDLNLSEKEFDIILTASGTEALYILTRVFLSPNSEVITTNPSYLIIHKFIELNQGICTNTPIYPLNKDDKENICKFKVEKINELINERTRGILLIDPLNPMGSNYTRKEVKIICEIAKDNKLFIINDITYRDFADEHTLATEFYPEGTIIVYSVSKNCGLAGMRVGALLGSKEIIAKLEPFNTNDLSINVLGQRASLVALQTKKEWMPRVKEITRKNQNYIRNAVNKISGVFLPIFPSQANMFVIDISATNISPEDVQNKLLYEHNIFVRAGNYVSRRFGKRFIRVSFSIPEEQVKKFEIAFPIVMEELKKK